MRKEVHDMKYKYYGMSLKDWASIEGNDKGKSVLNDWDFESNLFKLHLTTRKITYSSSKQVYWKCNKCGNSYLAKVCQKTHNNKQCPLCSNHNRGTSVPEQRLYETFKSLYPETVNRDRHMGFELDIYIPELEMAIEYNGTYFHKVLADKSERDAMKARVCAEKGVMLVQIWDDGDSIIPKISEDCKNIYYKCKQNILYSQLRNIADLIIEHVILADTKEEESIHSNNIVKVV